MKKFSQNILKTGAALALIAATVIGYGKFEDRRLQSLAMSIVVDVNDPQISAKFIENTLILEGVVPSQSWKDRTERIAQAHLSGVHLRNFVQKPQMASFIQVIPDKKKTGARKTASAF